MTLLSVSHLKQRQSADCLAACAVMALHYLALPTQYDRLTRLLGITRYGAVFSNLQRLESLGVSVLIEPGELETLRRHLDTGLPPLVPVETRWLGYWKVDTYHVVVVVGIEDETVYVNDPYFDTAPIAVSINEFIPAWVERKSLYGVMGLQPFEKSI